MKLCCHKFDGSCKIIFPLCKKVMSLCGNLRQSRVDDVFITLLVLEIFCK